MVDLIDDEPWIDHDTRADDGETARVEDAGWDEVERKGSLVGLHGVASVSAAIGPDDDVGGCRQGVSQLPLPLVAPLTPHHDCGGHRSASPDMSLWGHPHRAAGSSCAEL